MSNPIDLPGRVAVGLANEALDPNFKPVTPKPDFKFLAEGREKVSVHGDLRFPGHFRAGTASVQRLDALPYVPPVKVLFYKRDGKPWFKSPDASRLQTVDRPATEVDTLRHPQEWNDFQTHKAKPRFSYVSRSAK